MIDLLKQLQRHEEAIKVCDQIISQGSNSIKALKALYEKAALLEHLKNYEKAIVTYEEIINIINNPQKIKELKRRIKTLKLAIKGEKLSFIRYAFAVNPLLVSVGTGILLHSSWIFLLFSIGTLLVTAILFGFLKARNFNMSFLLAVVLFSFGWSWIGWLLLPTAIIIIVSFFIGFIINTFIFIFIGIYSFR